MDLQTLRDWVHRHNDEGLGGLRDWGRAAAVRRSFPRRSGRSSPSWSRLAPVRDCARSFAGEGLIWATKWAHLRGNKLADTATNLRRNRRPRLRGVDVLRQREERAVGIKSKP